MARCASVMYGKKPLVERTGTGRNQLHLPKGGMARINNDIVVVAVVARKDRGRHPDGARLAGGEPGGTRAYGIGEEFRPGKAGRNEGIGKEKLRVPEVGRRKAGRGVYEYLADTQREGARRIETGHPLPVPAAAGDFRALAAQIPDTIAPGNPEHVHQE